MTKEEIAKIELDKAYERLLTNQAYVRELMEFFVREGLKTDEIYNNIKYVTKYSGGIEKLVEHYRDAKAKGEVSSVEEFLKNKKLLSENINFLAKAGAGANFISDMTSEQGAGRSLVGLGADSLLIIVSSKAHPVFLILDIANLIDKMTLNSGVLDLRDKAQKLYDRITNTTADLPDSDALKKGILKITMPNGDVYARPLVNITENILIGDKKNDVLFGGSCKDIFIGHGGNDLFIGGDGKDDYFVNNSFITIKDSDGKGRVFDNNYKQLRGGTYSHSKNGEDKYFDGDTVYSLNKSTKTLHISSSGNGSVTIENFNKDRNDLDIVLLDPKDITVSISDNESSEGDSPNQSMKFKVKLNRKLEKEETLTLKINDEEIVFKENDQEKDFTYKWNGDTIKQEDRVFNVSATVIESKTSKNLKVRDIKQGTGKIIDDDRDPKDDLPETYDPIVIDFNKNGITSTKLDNTVYFDHDNNGFKEATAWIEKDDGLLVLDKNGNGKIDNGNELFGNHTISNTIYGYTDEKATNGYEALKAYDLNNDNVIDEKDEIFNKLKIWKDKNSNGITDDGELSSLTHNNIKSIDLNYKEIAMDENSNTVKQSSKVTLKDGSTLDANDVWFKVNLDKTKEEDINIPLEIRSLPKVKAFGNLNSLQVAASGNEKLGLMSA